MPVARVAALEPGVPHDAWIDPGSGSLALDGERELELGPDDARRASRLEPTGPRMRIDVHAAIAAAARDGS